MIPKITRWQWASVRICMLALILLIYSVSPDFGQAAPPIDFSMLSLPDSQVVYSPAAVGFNIETYLAQMGGALGSYQIDMGEAGQIPAAQIISQVAVENSINPRLLLALLDYQCECIQGSQTAVLDSRYALGVKDYRWQGLYGQLWWAANQLSAGYYGWREGWLNSFSLPDGSLYQPQRQANPGSVALQYYFAQLGLAAGSSDVAQLEQAWMRPLDVQHGFLATFQRLFGDPYELARGFEPNLTGGLGQPKFILPFALEAIWSFTSGPHQAWEYTGSQAALDFAPSTGKIGCDPSPAWVVAIADGRIVRSGNGLVVQDLDDSFLHGVTVHEQADGLEQTGWAVLYVHIAEQDRVPAGVYLRRGARIGHPSCEGGPATGVNLHIARKYNGEWIAAGGDMPFVLSGWTVHSGSRPYLGRLTRDGETVTASLSGNRPSLIQRTTDAARKRMPPQ